MGVAKRDLLASTITGVAVYVAALEPETDG